MTRTVLRVDGMNCGKCVGSVLRALDELPGVTKASATLEGRKATVDHEPGMTGVPAMIEVLKRQGYGARVVTD